MKFIDFLKPDSKKIIVLLIIIGLIIIGYLFTLLSLPPQYDLMKTYFSGYITIIVLPFLIPAMFLGELSKGGVWVPSPIFLILVVSAGLIFWYLVSSLIVLLWNNIFGFFGVEKRKYEKMFLQSLIVIFVIVSLLLPAISNYFIIIETKTLQNTSFDDALSGYTTPIKQVNFQEIRIKNNFILPVTYKLPNVTACVYDIEGNLKWGYGLAYRTEDGGFAMNSRNVIVAKPRADTKIYLQQFIGIQSPGIVRKEILNNLEKFDEIILLSNVGMDNYDYCNVATKEDILASKKIQILKTSN